MVGVNLNATLSQQSVIVYPKIIIFCVVTYIRA